MLGVVLFLVLGALGASVLPALVRVDEKQALAGLFGDDVRESVIARRITRVLEAAEAVVRLARFDEAMQVEAWNGTPFEIRRRSSTWCEWSFADGRRWLVRQRRRPAREARGVIVANARLAADGVAVAAYGPGGAFPEDTLQIVDATEVTPLEDGAVGS